MPNSRNTQLTRASWLAALLAGALLAGAALADVRAGASTSSPPGVTPAREASAAGDDPQALFDLAQAYRFGRGVPVDTGRAETLYARAAAAGNAQAADAYGLLLFETGRREAAMPYLEGAARRGDPRAEYLLGIAYFNGDFVELDWPRAYALMTRAKAAGLPQAAAALAAMERDIPLAQRQEAVSQVERKRAEAAGLAAAPPPAQSAPEGRWRIQLGAFSVPSNADALWTRLASRPELAGRQRLAVPSGRVTLLQAGGFPSRAVAGAACAVLKQDGYDCLVTGG